MNQQAGEQSRKKFQRKKRLKKNDEGLRELQDNTKYNNSCIIGILGGEDEQGIKKLFEKVMTESIPNLMREKVM